MPVKVGGSGLSYLPLFDTKIQHILLSVKFLGDYFVKLEG